MDAKKLTAEYEVHEVRLHTSVGKVSETTYTRSENKKDQLKPKFNPLMEITQFGVAIQLNGDESEVVLAPFNVVKSITFRKKATNA
jgi:hypothetical protein